MAEGDNNEQRPGFWERLQENLRGIADSVSSIELGELRERVANPTGTSPIDLRPIEEVRATRARVAETQVDTDEGADPAAPTPDRYAGLGPTGRQRLYLRSPSGSFDQLQEVPNDQVDELIRSGRAVFPAGVQVPVAEDGRLVGRVASENLAAFLRQRPGANRVLLGASLQNEVVRREAPGGERDQTSGHYSSWTQALVGAGQNAIEAFSPDIGIARREAVTRENARRQQEALDTGGVFVPVEDPLSRREANNSFVPHLGRFAPEVALGVLAPGASLAEIATLRAGAAAGSTGSVLQALATRASQGLARAGVAEGTAQGAGALAALGARSFGVNAVLDAFGQARTAELENRPLVASELISNATLSGLLGLGIEGAFLGIGAGVGRLARRTVRTAEEADLALREYVSGEYATSGSFVPTEAQKATARARAGLSGGQAEDIALIQNHPHTQDILAMSDAEVRSYATRSSESFVDIINRIDEVAQPEGATGAIARIGSLADTPVEAASTNLVARLGQYATRLRDSVADLEMRGATSVARRIRSAIQGLSEKTFPVVDGARVLRPGVTSGELFQDLFTLRNTIRDMGLEAAGGSLPANQSALINEAYAAIGDIMRDESVFGRAGSAYAEYAEPVEAMLSARERIASTVGTRRPGETRLFVDDGKLLNLGKTFETAKGGETVLRVVEDIKTIRDAMEKMASSPTLTEAGFVPEGMLDEVARSVDTAVTDFSITALAQRIRAANKAVGQAERQSSGILGAIGVTPERFGQAGAVAGAAAGAAVGGPVGAGVGAVGGYVAGMVGSAAARTSRTAEIRANLGRAIRNYDVRFTKAMKNLEKRINSATPLVTTSARVLPRIFQGINSEEKKNELYFRVLDDVNSFTGNPTGALERFEAATEGMPMNVAARLTEAGNRGLQYLKTIAPPVREDPFTGRRVPPSASQRDAFLRAFAGVDDPLVLLESLSTGNTPQETADAVRVAYPDYYAHVGQEAMRLFAQTTRRPPYSLRVQLARVLNIPTDPSLDPTFAFAMQQRYAQTPAQARSVGMSRQPARRAGTLSIATTYTASQELEQ